MVVQIRLGDVVRRSRQVYSTGGFKNKPRVPKLMLSVRATSTAKRFFLYLVIPLLTGHVGAAGQNNSAKPRSWSGILVSSSCNADEAFAESPECIKNVPDAKLALYDDTNRVMYGLEPQE